MGFPPATRWSIQRANGRYRDHLVGQRTGLILDWMKAHNLFRIQNDLCYDNWLMESKIIFKHIAGSSKFGRCLLGGPEQILAIFWSIFGLLGFMYISQVWEWGYEVDRGKNGLILGKEVRRQLGLGLRKPLVREDGGGGKFKVPIIASSREETKR